MQIVLCYEVDCQENYQMVSQKPKYCKNFEGNIITRRKLSMTNGVAPPTRDTLIQNLVNICLY